MKIWTSPYLKQSSFWIVDFIILVLIPFPFCTFLAAMSSSRSDVVTQFVRMSVRISVCPFFSFSVLGVSSAFFLVLKWFNRVSRKFKGCLKFQWCFKDVLRKFLGCLQKVSRVFKEVKKVFCESFTSVLRMIQGNFKFFFRNYEGCFK